MEVQAAQGSFAVSICLPRGGGYVLLAGYLAPLWLDDIAGPMDLDRLVHSICIFVSFIFPNLWPCQPPLNRWSSQLPTLISA